MNQKELEVQRALGTIDTYWLEITFPNKEEPRELVQLVSKTIPTATRYFGYPDAAFLIEAALSHIQIFTNKLTKILENTYPCSSYKAVVRVHKTNSDKVIFKQTIE